MYFNRKSPIYCSLVLASFSTGFKLPQLYLPLGMYALYMLYVCANLLKQNSIIPYFCFRIYVCMYVCTVMLGK